MGKNQVRKIMLLSIILMVLTTSQALSIDGVSKGDMVSFFRNIYVPVDTVVRGDVVSIFGNANVKGDVDGDVVAIFGKVDIDGKIKGDVVSIFGGITVHPKGAINGGGIAIMGHGIDNFGIIRQQEVSILGYAPRDMAPISVLVILILILTIIKHIFAFGFSIIAVLLFNERFDLMATGVNNDSGKKLLIGLLVYFGGFVGIAVLVMTVIGMPLVILLIPSILLLEFLGNTTAKIAIGRRIAQHLNKEWSMIMELLVGTLIYILLEISLVGMIFTLILKFIGIGEIIDSRLGEPNKTN